MPNAHRLATNHLELDPVGVIEEHRVIPRAVAVLLRPALDRRALVAQPRRAVVDDLARRRRERDVVDADAVAVVRCGGAGGARGRRAPRAAPPPPPPPRTDKERAFPPLFPLRSCSR